MDEKIREAVANLNGALQGVMPYKLDVVDPKEIKLLDKNARYMSHEMFKNLVNNISKDGALSSIPLCYRDPVGQLLALSGNHRIQAAVQAGLSSILVLVIDHELTREEQVAIQLSHNAIDGKDDPLMLKQLWDEIKEIDLKLYAGLDSEFLKELNKIEFVSIAETRLSFKQMVLMFLPEELDSIKAFMAKIDSMFSGDQHYLLSRAHYDEVFKLLLDVKDKYKIINTPTAFMKVIELARQALPVEERPSDPQR